MPREEAGELGSEEEKSLPSDNPGRDRIRLSRFIRENAATIVSQWEEFARTLKPFSTDMAPLALRDHIVAILEFITGDIDSSQTPLEQIRKSHGRKAKSSVASAAEIHAAVRLAGGFDIEQMVSEYRALRASVIKLWCTVNGHMDTTDIDDLTRFNESVDQQLAESVSHYTGKVNQSKDLFVGILGHDLRNPLQTIRMCAELILKLGALGDRQTMLAKQVVDSTLRISALINDLLDVTRARFGAGLPIIRAPMDMGYTGRLIVDETRSAHPTRTITLQVSGDVKGEWDKARIAQVFSNLLGNAMQYGFRDSAINVVVLGVRDEVIVSVYNDGAPIPPEKIGTIFKSLTRAAERGGNDPESGNLGLGLFITEDIVVSHGGRIHVRSSEEAGTTFTAHFPRLHTGAGVARTAVEPDMRSGDPPPPPPAHPV